MLCGPHIQANKKETNMFKMCNKLYPKMNVKRFHNFWLSLDSSVGIVFENKPFMIRYCLFWDILTKTNQTKSKQIFLQNEQTNKMPSFSFSKQTNKQTNLN